LQGYCDNHPVHASKVLMERRHFLSRSSVALASWSALSANAAEGDASPAAARVAPGPAFAQALPLAPIRASADRIIALNVCTRPFRAKGPRIEFERMGRKNVIHNYGHGGSGWSLSWGSARVAVNLARRTGEKHIAVIGCGAIGMTAAVMAQRAGLKVRIYAKDRLPEVRSSWATGIWSPDSRICTLDNATPEFENFWEGMARYSFRMYQDLLGLPGDPVEWRDSYALSDAPFGTPNPPMEGEPTYPKLDERLLRDMRVLPQTLGAGQHPFRVPYVRRSTRMVFNLAAYSRLLVNDFLIAGGEFVTAEFKSPKEFTGLREKTLMNCTGYGARALLADESIIPVRGQTARLVPQPEVNYGLNHASQHVSMTPRRDGLVVQASLPGDFNNADTTPDRSVSEAAVARLGALFAGA
jgi:glycine/D-amino acid oxidase-like deaminating enzyme